MIALSSTLHYLAKKQLIFSIEEFSKHHFTITLRKLPPLIFRKYLLLEYIHQELEKKHHTVLAL